MGSSSVRSAADTGAGAVMAAAERAWGDRAAGLSVVVRAVLAFELRLGVSDPTLDDLTQDVLRRALEGKDRLRPGAPLRPWVLGIARHVAADERRHRARTVPESPTSFEEKVQALVDPGCGPDELASRAERWERVRAALRALPETHRRAVLLFHVEDMSYQQIAKELGVPMGTVATWVSRGRARLLALVEEDDRS